MTSPIRTFAALCAALSLLAVATRAEAVSDRERAEFEKIIQEYLVAHPEAVQEALTALDRRQASAKADKQKAAIGSNRAELFASTRQVTIGNPDGDVTLVEFFDYNCGYCKRALADLIDLMKADPKLRVVLKEFPILGPGSVEAARVAVAVRMQDPGGVKYLEFHRKLLEHRGAVDKARALVAAQEVGLDMARLETDMASEEVSKTLEESNKLAAELGINGTPSYVVGERVMVGAVGLDILKERVATARN